MRLPEIGLMLSAVSILCRDTIAVRSNYDPKQMPPWEATYHYIIVGGGTAGCVLASRLSEDPKKNVLLLEAGPDDALIPGIEVPFGLINWFNSPIDWKFEVEPQEFAGKSYIDRTTYFHVGRILGGTSSINGLEYIRGNPMDFNAWAAAGNTGWSYEDVLPYFKKSERNLNPKYLQNGYHGFQGPWVVTDNMVTPNLTRKFMEAGKQLGYNETDLNGPVQEGFMHIQNTQFLGRAMSTSRAFLKPVMGRRNLKVITQAFVTKVFIKNRKAKGVMYILDNQPHFVGARNEVIISAGALSSPKVLMASGIGPEAHLTSHGIPVVQDLPGVGSGLTDNVMTDIAYIFNESISNSIEKYFNPLSMAEYLFQGKGLWASTFDIDTAFVNPDSPQGSGKDPLIQLKVENVLFGNGQNERAKEIRHMRHDIHDALHLHEAMLPGMTVLVVLNKPHHQGTVRLRSPNPADDPIITLNYLEDQRDVEDMIKGIRFLQKLAATGPFQSSGARLSVPTHPGCTEQTPDSDQYWECYLRHNTLTEYHYSSTCKMGIDSDPDVVVDNQLRVKGIKKLRVVDASVFPSTISGTMANVVMFAEKVADMIKGINSVPLPTAP